MDGLGFVFFVFIAIFSSNGVSADCLDGATRSLPHLELRSRNVSWDFDRPTTVDSDLSSGWFKAIKDGWQYIMTDESGRTPYYTDCNTYFPIYLKGRHPSLQELNETAIIRTACIRDFLGSCESNFEIKIRKCDGQFEYYLLQTRSYSAYCFESHSKLMNKTAAPSNVNIGTPVVVPDLQFEEKLDKFFRHLLNYIPKLIFRCNFSFNSTFFYKVKWYVNQDLLTVVGPSKVHADLTLKEDVLTSKNLILGIDLKCGVIVYEHKDGEGTTEVFSKNFFAGVKVLNTTVRLDKGSEDFIYLKPTVPLGCQHFSQQKKCKERLRIYVPHLDTSNTCTIQTILNSVTDQSSSDQCAADINALMSQDKWNPAEIYKFKIVTKDYNYDDFTTFRLRLQFTGLAHHKILQNYILPDVLVVVTNTSEYKNKICYAKVDPHMRTADGYYYEHHTPGTFLLYWNEKYGIEVQEKTVQCNSRATCPCGVAVRAGKDVFLINRCAEIDNIGTTRNLNYLDFATCGDGGILQVVKQDDLHYSVYTPIGTKIEIDLRWYASVVITMAPKDMNNVKGLCGYFDGDMTNDLLHRNGTSSKLDLSPFQYFTHYHNAFSSSWSIADNASANLFKSPHEDNYTSWKARNGLYCICSKNFTGAQALCASTQYLNCTLKDSITHKKCSIINRRRSTRASHYKELNRLFTLMNSPSSTFRTKRQTTITDGFTEQESEQICTAKIQKSLAVQSYQEVTAGENPDIVVKQCIQDILASNQTFWADAHLDSVNNIVKDMMEKMPTYVEQNEKKVEVFLENTCPGNCSGNGNCEKSGKCTCTVHHHGSDCSIDERDALIIDDIEGGGECDLAEGGDCDCFKIRTDKLLEGHRCSVRTSKMNITGDVSYVSRTTSKGGYEDIFTTECCVEDNIAGDADVFVAVYDVSISNDGVTYSNVAPVHVFDSTCQKFMVNKNSNRKFSLKSGYCFLDGHCVPDGEMANSGCLACNTSVSLFDWTAYNPCLNGGRCNDEEVGYTCTCQPGYNGTKCQNDIDECASNPCGDHGTCQDLVNSFECTCEQGYVGFNCETDFNECSSSPCQNEGTCTDWVNGYFCNCAAGYTGTKCQIEIDECESNPCKNGANCTDQVNHFTCNCNSGYIGTLCDKEINECESNPCKNGASCTDQVNRFTCTCTPGYNGTLCETDINDCESNPCKNEAKCTDQVNSYTCTCKAGYSGSLCEIEINECESNPCKNGASCTDQVNRFTCTCNPGYNGTLCETEINECESNPCKNGASCTDQVNRFTCTCNPGYNGTLCETEINECESNPCKNGASCTDKVNRFTCTCTPGYNGTLCETDVNECDANPCGNHGTCEDRVNGYRCTCELGYVGNNCDTDINECESNPCRNGANCTDQVNQFTCTCNQGYNGTLCETDINECASSPCGDHGACEDMENGYSCTCDLGYVGTNCETDIDECSSHPCGSHGTCVDTVNAYRCTCESGYTGMQCEREARPCESSPCGNGGTCNEKEGGYECTCVAGYSGSQCQNGCGGNFAGPEGYILSWNYPKSYTNNLDCSYTIVVESSKKVEIKFIQFNLEYERFCRYDSVTVYDVRCDGTVERQLLKVCGSSLPASVTSQCNQMLIVFKTDYNVNREGFQIHYRTV